jgi:hypothetical protein
LPERFQALETVAASGGWQLVRARDTLLEREVFLKWQAAPAGEARSDESAAGHRLREARALARLQHPAIHHLLDVLETPAGMLLVLEPVCGETLEARLQREERLGPDDALRLGIALAGALEAVHAAGLVHRAVESGNVLLGEAGSVKLTGFQLAKPSSPGRADEPSSLLGKPSGAAGTHPAPEQVLKGEDGPRADLFGLGWILYECLTGRAPYAGKNPATWTPPDDVRDAVPEAPLALSRTIALCLAPSPSHRPQDAAEVRAALEAERGEPANPEPAAAAPAASRPGRKPLWATVAVASAAALGYLLVGGPIPMTSASNSRGVELSAVPAAVPLPRAETRADYLPLYAHSYALLIGIGDAYAKTGLPVLANAERDARSMAEALGHDPVSPWTTDLLLGEAATRNAIIDGIAHLSDRAGPDDRILVFYAGHGKGHTRAEGSGWLLPAGAQPGPEGRPTWIRFDEFGWLFREARAKHILVAMDCCYGGRLVESRGVDPVRAYSDRFLTRKAHVVIASGLGDEEVSDGVAGGNSPFAKVIVSALEEHGGPLLSSDLFVRVQHAIVEGSVGQTPVVGTPEGSPIGGQFVFFRER